MMKLRWMGVVAVLALAGVIQAAELVYEGFDYASTSNGVNANALSGGTGLSGSWTSTGTGNFNVTSNSYTVGSLTVSGNKLKRTATGGTEGIARTISAALPADFWFSAIYNTSANSTFAIGGGTLNSGSSGNGAMTTGPGYGFRHQSGNLKAVAWPAGSGVNPTAGANVAKANGETILLVGHVQRNVGGNDTVDIYEVDATLLQPASPITSVTIPAEAGTLNTVTMSSNRGPGYDEIRIGDTYADVVPASAEFSFTTTPPDQKIIAVNYPATSGTNSIVAEFANSAAGVEIIALNVSNESNAFSAVTSVPLTMNDPSPSNTVLEFAYDPTAYKDITGATAGFTRFGAVDIIWSNLTTDVVGTNTVSLEGNYSNPAFQFNIDSSLGLTLVAPATTVSNDISVSYVEGRPGHTNVVVVAVNVLDASHAGFSTVNPGVIANPEPSNDVISVIFDNTAAGLTNKQGATANLEVIWGEVGGTTSTSTVPVSAFYYDLPGNAVVQQVFGNPVNIIPDAGGGLLSLNNFGAWTNNWVTDGSALAQDLAAGCIKLKSAGNTRSAFNLIEAGTAGMDNFGAADTQILTNGLYRYDFDYEVLNSEGAAELWSFEAYTLVDQQEYPPSNNTDRVRIDIATGTSGGVPVNIENNNDAYASQYATGTLGGTSDVARSTGSVYLNVQDGDDAVFVMHRSGKCTVRLYDLVLTRVGDYVLPVSPTNAVLDATFSDASTTNAMLHDALYDYNDAGANRWAYGASAKWKNRALQNVSSAGNSRSIAIVTRAGTAGYDDVGVQDTIALTGGVYTVSLDVNFAAVTNIGHGSITVFSFAGVDTATGNVNDVRLDLSEGTNVAAVIEASQVPKLRGSVLFSELARKDYSNDVSETVVFNDLAVQDGEDLAIRITSYFNADFNAIDNVQVLRTGNAPLVGYAAWVDTYGLTGNDALLKTDVEPDGLDNLLEYALGGVPNVDDAATVKPATFTAMDLGTNWFYHVHNERTDDPRLSYSLGRKGDLIYGTNWTSGAIQYVGESAVVDNIKSVTNRTDVGDKEFIRLKVDKID